jgi:glycoprotein 6-alpha-L-fucosyltransferase
MQIYRGDAAASFHSLDDIYYFGGQQAHQQIAIENHQKQNTGEIDLMVIYLFHYLIVTITIDW